MGIQYGSSVINAIKYCDQHGLLQDVTKVIKSGLIVYQLHDTSNNGIWTATKDGVAVEVLPWASEYSVFLSNSQRFIFYFDDGTWNFEAPPFSGNVMGSSVASKYSRSMTLSSTIPTVNGVQMTWGPA